MKSYVHKPERWDKEAAILWRAGLRAEAAERAKAMLEEILKSGANPHPDAFIQPAFYCFQIEEFAKGIDILVRAVELYPDHPMIRLTLGSLYTRARRFKLAIPHLNHFLSLGFIDASAFDALAHAHSEGGDPLKARIFGSMALDLKDRGAADRHRPLDLSVDPAGKRKVIAFSLFGSRPRYLRGSLQNVLVARDLYPDWTCRFYVDDSVDATFLEVLAEEGAELVVDDSGNRDIRHLLTRRFLVSDDPSVGYFMVRDADSVVSPREAAAVDEWIASGLPFHSMRDWYTHTDPILAGMWGGIAGVGPNMAEAIERFTGEAPLSTNWDQFFLRVEIWPAIRDHCMVHDRYFSSHAARPFPTPTPEGREHVGQNEYASSLTEQARALMDYADRIPALGIGASPTTLVFKPDF
jgi:hypothetical protein